MNIQDAEGILMASEVEATKENKPKKQMTAQTRLILAGLAVSTAFIFCTAGFAVYSIDKNMNNAYKNFGQVLSKTLAIEGVELTKEIPQLAKYDALRSNSVSILKSNDDIAFIIFKDNNSKTIYSSKDDYPEQAEKARITVSSPMIVKNLAESKNVGSVTVGLSGTIMDNISKTTKFSIATVFSLAWLVIMGIIYMNSSIITSELRKLYQGVKKISSGEFGYKLDGKNVDNEAVVLKADPFGEAYRHLVFVINGIFDRHSRIEQVIGERGDV